MDASTLSTAMGGVLPFSRYAELVGPMNDAMIAANCNTVNRAAMWCAQVGHESVGLKYMEEIASGAAYEGRSDLGNTQRGDGVRFKGRGPIQLTGRGGYLRFGQWAASRGYVSDPNTFVNQPTLLSQPRWGFLAATYYWIVARNMNSYADRGDILGATKAVNGGTNGLADRTRRWNLCRPLGARLLPTASGDDMTPQESARLARVERALEIIVQQMCGEMATIDNPFPGSAKGGGWECDDKVRRTLVDIGRRGLEKLG